MRDAGQDLGWEEDFYGPQNALEEIRNATIISKGEKVVVPGYFVLDYDRSLKSHNIGHWYGVEFDEHQRYSNFKVLIQRKGAPSGLAVDQPSWHLDVMEMRRCFSFDFTDLPISDFLWRKLQDGLPLRPALAALDDDGTEAITQRRKWPMTRPRSPSAYWTGSSPAGAVTPRRRATGASGRSSGSRSRTRSEVRCLPSFGGSA